MNDFITQLQEQRQSKKEKAEALKESLESKRLQVENANRISETIKESSRDKRVVVQNKDLAKSKDIDSVINELKDLQEEIKEVQLTTLLSSQAQKSPVILADSTDLGDKIEELGNKITTILEMVANDKSATTNTKAVTDAIRVLREQVAKIGNSDVTEKLTELVAVVESKEYNPVINLQPTKVTVPKLDITPIKDAIQELKTEPVEEAVKLSDYVAQQIEEPVEGVQYVGMLKPNGDWCIIMNDSSANSMGFKFGAGDYRASFKERESFTYKFIDEAVMEWKNAV